jgi:23S rRNA (cytosine1962-C5)-methyltransferase
MTVHPSNAAKALKMFLKHMPFNSQTIFALKNAFTKREGLRKRTNALRLVNGIGDRLEGLVLEQYNKHFVAQVFNAFWIKEANQLEDFLKQNFEIDYFIVKDRSKNSSSNPEAISVQVKVQKASSSTVIRENDCYFEVDLNDTLNTGLFLDMRANRDLVGRSCAGKKVLNCFSYTCSFGIYARVNRASGVVNVDVSKKILEKGQHNYKLNQIEPQPNEFIKADALGYLEKALKKNNRFDVIVLDPPSFARSEGKVFKVEKDLPHLIILAASILNEKGKMLIATNSSGISHARLEQYLKAAKGRTFKKILHLGQDKDFVGSDQAKESHLAALWVE